MMPRSAFRFVAALPDALQADEQFWRDVDAADRLGSQAASSFFLRELCRAKAIDDVGTIDNDGDVRLILAREQALLNEIETRGYALGGVTQACPKASAGA